MCDGDEILPQHLPTKVTRGHGPVANTGDAILTLEEVGDRYLSKTLATFDGDRKSLAEQLGLSERALYRRISRLREQR